MSDGAIKIELSAEDKASAVIKNAMNETDKALSKSEVQTLKNTKATTEFFGSVSNLAGGGVLSSVAGQLGQLTEKASQFAQTADKGSASALAFQGGLVAAAAVIGWQVGSAINDLTSDLQATIDEMTRLEEAAERLHQRSQRRLQQDLNDRQRRIEAAGGGEAAIQAEIARINKEIDSSTETQQQMSAQESARAATVASGRSLWSAALDKASGGDEAAAEQKIAEQNKRAIDRERERQEVLMETRHELQRMIGIEAELAEQRSLQAQAEKQTLAQDQQYLAVMEERNQRAQAELQLAENKSQQSEVTQQLTLATPAPELQANESRLLTTGRDSDEGLQKQIAKTQEEQKRIAEQSRTLLGELKSIMQKMSQAPGVRVEVVS